MESTGLNLLRRGAVPVGFLNWRFGGDQPAELPEIYSPQIEELQNAFEMWQRILGRHRLGQNRLNIMTPQGQNGF